jgi:hypothetical protein
VAKATVVVLCAKCGQPKFAFKYGGGASAPGDEVVTAVGMLASKLEQFTDLGRLLVVRESTPITDINAALTALKPEGNELFTVSKDIVTDATDFDSDWVHSSECRSHEDIVVRSPYEVVIPAAMLPEGFGHDVRVFSDRAGRMISPFQPIPQRGTSLVRPPSLTLLEMATEAIFQTRYVHFGLWSWWDVAFIAWQLRLSDWHHGLDLDVSSPITVGGTDSISQRFTIREDAPPLVSEILWDWQPRTTCRALAVSGGDLDGVQTRVVRMMIALDHMCEGLRLHWIARGSPGPQTMEFAQLADEIGVGIMSRRMP